MHITTMEELIEHQIQDLYDAENQIIKALPKIADATTSEKLKEAFSDHLAQTKDHVKRLEKVCDSLAIDPKGSPCAGMQGLLNEGDEVMKHIATGSVLDAALIGAAQRVEHYEMAGYGTLITHLEEVGEFNSAEILRETLTEEKQADEKLTFIAEDEINQQAADTD